MTIRFQVTRLSGWRAIVAVLAGLVGLVAVIALLTVGFFLVVLPALVVAAIAWRFLPKAKVRSVGSPSETGVIEGTYEIAPEDAKRLERQNPP